jgi:hypothetical protein
VGHAAAVQPGHEAPRGPVVAGIVRPFDLHRAAFDPLAPQACWFRSNQPRRARHASEVRERPGLAAAQPARQPGEPPGCGARIPNHDRLAVCCFAANRAEQVGSQQFHRFARGRRIRGVRTVALMRAL